MDPLRSVTRPCVSLGCGWAAIAASVTLLACNPSDGTAPVPGSIRLTVTTAGVDHDPDGYEVTVGDVRERIATVGTVTLQAVFPPGVRVVRLDGVARNCAVTSRNPQSVTVRTGKTVDASFSVACRAFTTNVSVTVTTSGADPDENGYLVRIGPAEVRAPANGVISFGGVPTGSHALHVGDIAPNCAPTPSVLRAIVIVPFQENVQVDIAVACVALGRVEMTTNTTGAAPDATGYTVTAANFSTGAVAATAVAAPSQSGIPLRLAPGDHVVWLRDVAGNCVPRGPRMHLVPITSGATLALRFDVDCPAPTPVAFVATGPSGTDGIYVVGSSGGDATPLTHHAANDTDPAWSPDGTRIAFTSDRSGERAIYVMKPDGSDVMRLTNNATSSYRPAWSPDGQRIVFVGEQNGNADLYVMNADGTNRVRLTNHLALDTDPDWSPDGSRVAFTSERDGNAEIYTLELGTSRLERVTHNQDWNGQPAWSPDGTRLAFAQQHCSGFYWAECHTAVMVADPTGADAEEVALGEAPAWSRDGSRLAITRLACTFFFYEPPVCVPDGVGIVAPYRIERVADHASVWEPSLTHGPHRSPSWQP